MLTTDKVAMLEMRNLAKFAEFVIARANGSKQSSKIYNLQEFQILKFQ